MSVVTYASADDVMWLLTRMDWGHYAPLAVSTEVEPLKRHAEAVYERWLNGPQYCRSEVYPDRPQKLEWRRVASDSIMTNKTPRGFPPFFIERVTVIK